MHPECTHSTFNSFLDGWCRDIWHPRALRDSRENTEIHRAIHANAETRTERDEMKTKQILKISAAPAGVLCAPATRPPDAGLIAAFPRMTAGPATPSLR